MNNKIVVVFLTFSFAITLTWQFMKEYSSFSSNKEFSQRIINLGGGVYKRSVGVFRFPLTTQVSVEFHADLNGQIGSEKELNHLISLALIGFDLDEFDVRQIALASKLECLILTECMLSPKTFSDISKIGVPSLHVNRNVMFSDAHISAALPTLNESLENLVIWHTSVTEDGLLLLSTLNKLKSLRMFSYYNNIDTETIEALRAKGINVELVERQK